MHAFKNIITVNTVPRRGLENSKTYLLNWWCQKTSRCTSANSKALVARSSCVVRTWAGTGNAQLLCVFALNENAVLVIVHNQICQLCCAVYTVYLPCRRTATCWFYRAYQKPFNTFLILRSVHQSLNPLPPGYGLYACKNVETCEPPSTVWNIKRPFLDSVLAIEKIVRPQAHWYGRKVWIC